MPATTARPKHLGKVLEGSVDIPMSTLAGLVLRASGKPDQLAKQWVSRADREATQLLHQPEAYEAELLEVVRIDANSQSTPP